jgi:UDP-glucose 4-epimerase
MIAKSEKMRILVTGGCGFIGSHLVEALQLQYPQSSIVVVDDLRVHNDSGGEDIPLCDEGNVQYVFESLQSPGLVEVLSAGQPFDYIFHLANTPRVRRAIEFPRETIDNNVTSTTAVCDIAMAHSAHVFFAQSSSIKYLEDTVDNPYTLSKVMADMVLDMYQTAYGVQVTSMFYYSVYGPREANYGPYSTVIRRFKQRIEQGEPLEIFGNGAKQRDFTHVIDVVDNMILMLRDPKVLDGTMSEVHFGRSDPKSILSIATQFQWNKVHLFDKPGEAQKTFCEDPYGVYTHNVMEYIDGWRSKRNVH